MTLYELSLEYTCSADLLKERIHRLRAQLALTEQEHERLLLNDRLRILRAMWRQTRETALYMEHYYDRGYRNE